MNRRLEELNWSLVDLATATDESYRNVHRWVRDEVKIPAHFITRFAKVVPVDPAWLVTGEGTPERIAEGPAKRALEHIARVLDSVRLSTSEGVITASIVERSRDGIFAVDRQLRYTLWNPVMESIAGVQASSVLGTEVFEVFPDVPRAKIVERLREALRGEETTIPSTRFPGVKAADPETGRRSGSDGAFWCEGHFHPLRSGSGDIVGGMGVLRDVTDMKRAAERRSEAEERYQVLMEMTTKPSFLQAEGTVVEANGPLEELAGCNHPGELRGARVDELLSSRSLRRPVSDALKRIAVGEWWGPAPAVLTRRDASSLLVEVVAAGVRFEGDVATQALLRTSVAAD